MSIYERDDEEAPVTVPTVVSPPLPVPSAPDVGFRNPVAVRIGVLVALLSFFASALSGPILILPLVWLLAAGFLSVYLYRRRTGLVLSPGSGARMGWMTGLFAFLILLVMVTTIVLLLSDQRMAARLLEEMPADVNAEHMVEAFQNPSGVTEIVLVSFIVFTLFPTIGGALGAKFFNGRPR